MECSEVKVKVTQNKTTPVKYRYLKKLLKYSNEEVLLRYWPPLLDIGHNLRKATKSQKPGVLQELSFWAQLTSAFFCSVTETLACLSKICISYTRFFCSLCTSNISCKWEYKISYLMQQLIFVIWTHQKVTLVKLLESCVCDMNRKQSACFKIIAMFIAELGSRDATIPFFQNQSDTANSEDRPVPIQSNTSAGFYFCNLEFLYFSVLTHSSLFCVLNTIYYSVSQLVGQKCWVCSPKVCCETVLRGSRIVYCQESALTHCLSCVSSCLCSEDVPASELVPTDVISDQLSAASDEYLGGCSC